MASPNPALERLLADTGFRRLNPLWAKLEIVLGLLAVGCALLWGGWTASRAEVDAVPIAGALLLFVLGGYLALAGHRSHLYQSNNQLSAYLAELIRRSSDKDSVSHEHSR